MKTIEELYNEVKADKGLQEKLTEAGKTGKVEAFLKDHGCNATLEEVIAFAKTKAAAEEDAPLSMDELGQSAGGLQEGWEIALSIISAGTLCALAATVSAASDGMHVGQRDGDSGRLCNKD